MDKPVDLKAVNPNAAAFELDPGKFYLLVIKANVSTTEVQKARQALKDQGVNAIVWCVGPDDHVDVYEAESKNGAVTVVNAPTASLTGGAPVPE